MVDQEREDPMEGPGRSKADDFQVEFDWHDGQYEEMQRSTASMIEFIGENAPTSEPKTVLDIGCGGAANIYYYKDEYPKWEFTGIDIDEEALNLAREKNEHATFKNLDFKDIVSEFGENSFDYITATGFLLHYQDKTDFFERTTKVAREGIFINSLFSKGWVEQRTWARELDNDFEWMYIIYSLPQTEQELEEIAPNADLTYEEFEIDIDLPKPDDPQYGTYTVKTEDGKRLQISGYILLPWHHVFVQM